MNPIKCFLLAIMFAFVMVQAKDVARGFSDKINWVDGLTKAKEIAKQEGKPIVALVHKTWCGACKRLKSDFQSGNAGVERVIRSSADYVMVNLEDDEAEGISELEPTGASYIPRVIFFSPDGTARPDIKSKANPSYAYFYPSADSLGQVMESALSSLKKTSSSEL